MILKGKDLKFSLLDVESLSSIYSHVVRIIFALENHKRNICGLVFRKGSIILINKISNSSPTTIYY